MSEENQKCSRLHYLLFDVRQSDFWQIIIDYLEESILFDFDKYTIEYEWDVDRLDFYGDVSFDVKEGDAINNVFDGIMRKLARSILVGEKCRYYNVETFKWEGEEWY